MSSDFVSKLSIPEATRVAGWDRLRSDAGSAGISSFFAVTSLLLLLGLGVAGMRTFIGQGDVSAAARAGARAAAFEYDYGEASAQATTTATTELGRTGLACTNPTVTLDTPATDFRPGEVVEVTVTCTTSFGGLFVPWSSGTKQLTATGVEPIDCLRGDWQTTVVCAGFP